MPVEIKELHIRVTVDTAQSNPPEQHTSAPPAQNGQRIDAIVAACVEQVLQILKQKMER